MSLKKTLAFILPAAFLLASQSFAAGPILWGPNSTSTSLQSGVLFGSGSGPGLLTGSLDPTSVAVLAPAGSVYLSSSTNSLYSKQDAGSSTNWSRAMFQPANTVTTRLFVAPGGVDAAGCGSIGNPCAHGEYASASITDACTSVSGGVKRYLISYLGGTYNEPTLTLRNCIYYVGAGGNPGMTYVRVNNGAGSVVVDSAGVNTAANFRGGIKGIYLGGGTGMNLDIHGAGYSNPANASHIEIDDVAVTGNLTINGRDQDNDYSEIYNTQVFGSATIDSQQTSPCVNSFFYGTFTQLASWASSYVTFQNTSVSGAALFHTTTGALVNFTVSGSNFGSTFTTTIDPGQGLVYLATDNSSLPTASNVSLAASTVRTYLSDASGVHYAPTTPGNWTSQPSQVYGALDILASSKQPNISNFSCPANQWIDQWTGPNTFTCVQPGFTNLSGSISAAQMLALPSADIYVGNGSNQPAAVAMSGDVHISNTGATTIQPNVVTNADLAQMAANTIKGNNTGGLANAADLTTSQVNTMLGDVTTLSAVGASPNANGATISGNTLNLQPFDATHPGVVPASGGGTINYLRADGQFAQPAAASGQISVAVAPINFNSGTQTISYQMNSTNIVSVAGNHTIGANELFTLVDTSGGAYTITLPAPNYLKVTIKDSTGNSQTNPITLARHGSELIEGVAANRTLTGNFNAWTFVDDGTNWHQVY